MLKFLVIGMGVMLLAAVVGAIVLALGGKAKGPEKFAFETAELQVPEGCEIAEMMAEGDRLILRIAGSAKCNRILVGDLRSGKLIGAYQLSGGKSSE